MLARLQLTLAALLALVALALGGVLLFGGKGGAAKDAAYTLGPTGFAGAVSPPGARAANFRLTTQDGKPASITGERGKVTVLTFLYTTCQDTCPITASQILGALDDLPDKGKGVAALAVSVDPANDTPELAKKFLLNRRITGRMDFALGDRAQLQPVWRAYGIQPQGSGKTTSTTYEHSARVLLIDKRGFQRVAFPQDELQPEALAHDIKKLEAEPG